jgi:hypothetical protein
MVGFKMILLPFEKKIYLCTVDEAERSSAGEQLLEE